MGFKADLHLHTNHSDGFLSPAQLLSLMHQNNIIVAGITDHDTVNAMPDCLAYGEKFGIEIIPGVELSSIIDDREIHILGLFINWIDPSLIEYLSFFRYERMRRAERIVEKLNNIDVPLTIESVMEKAGAGAVGRPHIASALVDGGLATTYHQAFNDLIGIGRPAYEGKFRLEPAEAIKLIASAGGLSFLAHPGKYMSDDIIGKLIRSGIDGIEVVHPSHSSELTRSYRALTDEYFLLESGGSDFHGGKRSDEDALGKYWIDQEKIDAMKRRLFNIKSA